MWWQKPEQLAAMTPERWRGGIKEYANGVWDYDRLGPPPGDPGCVVPHELIEELRLTEIYDHNGIKRRSFQ
jgi:hypothetical protein